MEREELRAWLRLLMTPRIGPGTARKLLLAFASPQGIFEAGMDACKTVVSAREAAELAKIPEDLDAQTDATMAWLDSSPALADGTPARHVLCLADAAYPRTLLDAADPPLLLFAQGRLGLLQAPGVAIVGSRSPSPQGHDNAFAFAKALAEAGITVVSGLAQGIDGAAHEGALAAGKAGLFGLEGGSTIAVVGTGLDRVYPKVHHALAMRIAEQGLMLSEFLLGTPPLSPNFPKRNRIVAALTRGTLVVEAALQSGSLITARLAAEMGREVLAIPGSIHLPQSRGCHALIKQGAKLVETAADVLEELHLAVPHGSGQAPVPAAQPSNDSVALDDAASEWPDAAVLPEEEGGIHRRGDPVLDAMGFDPVSQEALSARTGMGPAELGARLLELELCGEVARLPGQLFQRVSSA